MTFQSSGAKTSLTTPALCSLNSAGSCSVPVSTSGVGIAYIAFSYSGDANNNAGSGNGQLSITKAQSSTSLVCAPSTVTAGQPASCTATVTGYSPGGTVLWQSSDQAGVFSSNPCTLSTASCGVSYTAKSSAVITAFYQGDQNNTVSQGTFSLTANINEKIQITVANSGPVTSVALSGCSVSPTTVQADGAPHLLQADSGCSGIVAALPPAGANTRYLTATGKDTLTVASCSSSSCPTISATVFYQVENTYQASPTSPATWSTPGTIDVSGTALGLSGQAVCTIAVATGAGQFSCQGWTDYNTQATMGALQISPTQRWGTAQSSFTDTTGGAQHASSYYAQVLEDFEYSLVGSTTAPAVPNLAYTAFGAASAFPLTGSESLVWLDTGSSWSVPAALSGSNANERWQNPVTAGAATAGATIALTYYHQFLINFAYSVVGGGSAYSPPTVAFTAFGAPAKGTQGWVDAGSQYGFTNPLGGSSAAERWFTAGGSGVASAAGTVSAAYFHQYGFSLNFTVTGGGAHDQPRLNFTSFGSPGVEELNATRTTFWVDAGTKWGATRLLPTSSSTERWATKQTTSGTASAPLDEQLVYYHQFLGALRYSINGQGGSPPVPRVNYTALGTSSLSQLNDSSAFWMDSGATWAVPPVMAGGSGERWLSNTTGSLASGPFQLDAQYTHQFFVEVGVSTPAGGAVGNTNQWHDQGASVALRQTSASLWRFAYWQGATPFSYNGTTPNPTLLVTGAANETAIFFPGLNIATDDEGSVTYAYGSINGTVPAGTNATIYVPPGRNVTLTAVPKNVEITFDGWTGGAIGALAGMQPLPTSASKLQTSLSIASPSAVHASFAVDYTDIRTFALATIAVVVAACYAFIVKRGYTPKLGSQSPP
jgi:hypothetical protein